MDIGDVELQLGMRQDAVIQLLKKYQLTVVTANQFSVSRYDQSRQAWYSLGLIRFDNDELSYISRVIDTSAWPANQGFAVGNAIYDAFDLSISAMDNDGTKRATATIEVSRYEARDASQPAGKMRTIDIYIDSRKIQVLV